MFAARYASVCLCVYLLALSIMKFLCILADAHVCVHMHDVCSHECLKHSPANYKCIYNRMGKTPIFSIEINRQILSNLSDKNRSHQSQYKEGILLPPFTMHFNISNR